MKRVMALLLAIGASYSASLNRANADGFLSGTYLDPALQREDILRYPIIKAWPEYRYTYNRPRYVGGHIASVIEPSSQEAMAWRSSVNAGHYRNHAGRCVPLYYYPKPWEAINTMARPDRPMPEDVIIP
jgi:hypothetical protein